MPKISYTDVYNVFPSFFETNLNEKSGAESIFENLGKIFEFDDAFIYFANPESLQLKFSFNEYQTYATDITFPFNPRQKKLIFSEDNYITDCNHQIIKMLKLEEPKRQYLIVKLIIRSTVFGIIVLSKKNGAPYNADDLATLKTCACMISYVIKDMELSNVFKIQLKALKDGIIEKNNAYKTIKEQNEKILEADKVKNEFLANVSHELRTPLNAILGFAEILQNGLYGKLCDKQNEFVNEIRVSGLRLLGMINEILDISKIEAKAMKISRSRFSIDMMYTEVCNVLRPLAAKKNIRLIKEFEEDFEVFADYQKMQQVFYNLVSNAIKFTPENGEITLDAKNLKKKVILSVHDTGIGIDAKYHGKIFAKFVQLDSAYTKKESSTGLGLTITKELVELHSGKISVKSEVNNGSTFIVELPIVG